MSFIKNRIVRSAALALAACVLLSGCVLGFAACGENEHGLDPNNPTRITVWHYYNGKLGESFKQQVEAFNLSVGAEKGIVVTEKPMGSITSIEEKLAASLNDMIGSDELPDIFSTYADTAYSVRANLADLNDYMSKEELAEFVDAYIEEGKIAADDGVYILPVAKATEVLSVNKTDWDKFQKATNADASKLSTWEGIVELSAAYYDWSEGKAFFGRDAFANYMFVGSAQLGHPIVTVTNDAVTFDYDEATLRKLWDNYYVPYVSGWFYAGGKYRTDDIKTGDILAGVGSTSGVSFFPDKLDFGSESTITGYPIESMILPVPNFASKQPYAVQQGAGMAIIKSEEKREYASSVFLKWFTEKEHSLEFSFGSSYLPVKKSANSEAAVREYLQSDNVNVKAAVADSLLTSAKTVNGSTLYTPKPFAQGTKARSVLEKSMPDLAKADRAKIVAGELTPAECTSDAHFREWVGSLKSELNKLTGR